MGDPVTPDGREAPKLRVVSRNEDFVSKVVEKPRRAAAHPPAVPAIYTSIGDCVAMRRRERGLSQREFAFSLGIKPALLQSYEDGGTIFTPDLLLRAAEILEVRPAEFFALLAEKRLAELSSQTLPLIPTVSVVDEADKIRLALFETISKCDSIITILDIIDVSKKREYEGCCIAPGASCCFPQRADAES